MTDIDLMEIQQWISNTKMAIRKLIINTEGGYNLQYFKLHKKFTKIISNLYWHLLKMDIIYMKLANKSKEC